MAEPVAKKDRQDSGSKSSKSSKSRKSSKTRPLSPDTASDPSFQPHIADVLNGSFHKRLPSDEVDTENGDVETLAKRTMWLSESPDMGDRPPLPPIDYAHHADLERVPVGYDEGRSMTPIEYDAEKASYAQVVEEERVAPGTGMKMWYFCVAYLRPFVHIVIWLLFTGWWIASLKLHRDDKNWVIPFLVWLAISLRVLFWYISIRIVTVPMHFVWNNTGVRVAQLIPEGMRIPLGALAAIVIIIIGSMASAESNDNTRANRAISLFGLGVFIFVLWLTSRNRALIKVSRLSVVLCGLLKTDSFQ